MERRHFQQGDRELKDAITNISHDLRTPLTAICGYLDLLEQEEKTETVKRYIEIIQDQTEILNQLTNFSNIQLSLQPKMRLSTNLLLLIMCWNKA